jgi:hypothetical protein
MNKREFEDVAKCVRAVRERAEKSLSAGGASHRCADVYNGEIAACMDIAMNLADILKRTNDKFDEKEFLRACGILY